MTEPAPTVAIPFDVKYAVRVSACEHGPQIDVTELLRNCQKIRVVFGNRSYLLRLTAKGGVQLCAEA